MSLLDQFVDPKFLQENQAGFWEQGGYHMRGVPWGPGDGERFR